MKRIEKILDYFFSLKGELNQKKYFLHYFFDLLFFTMLIFFNFAVFFVVELQSVPDLKTKGLPLSFILLIICSIISLSFLIMNRLSIILRRLKYLRMNKMFGILVFFPPISLILEFYLFALPDSDESLNKNNCD